VQAAEFCYLRLLHTVVILTGIQNIYLSIDNICYCTLVLLLVILVARLVGGWKIDVLRESAKFMPQNMDCRLAKLGSYRLIPDNIQTLPLSNFRVTFDPGDRLM